MNRKPTQVSLSILRWFARTTPGQRTVLPLFTLAILVASVTALKVSSERKSQSHSVSDAYCRSFCAKVVSCGPSANEALKAARDRGLGVATTAELEGMFQQLCYRGCVKNGAAIQPCIGEPKLATCQQIAACVAQNPAR